MKRLCNFLLLIILLIFTFFLSGCTNSHESLENYNYVMAIGIDKGEKTRINLSIQVASNSNQNSSDSGSSQSSSSIIYSVPCNTIDSGINIFNNYLSKRLNLSHCSAIIFSEELAKTRNQTIYKFTWKQL